MPAKASQSHARRPGTLRPRHSSRTATYSISLPDRSRWSLTLSSSLSKLGMILSMVLFITIRHQIQVRLVLMADSAPGAAAAKSMVDVNLTRALGGLDLNTEGGKTSPQLPSPVSGASSRNGVDQNPPDYQEESLRELFSVRAGFRRLCFQHKNNGPMYFGEFEDVPYATKTLNELHGDTLKGLVTGGNRLNPLCVRTPTSAGNNGPSMQ
ncbi:hypothetical protein DXG01_016209 [Tephrocybe rancida]|nr:hypothetical protein DXG01_016209 [Tephrocybe rancida]